MTLIANIHFTKEFTTVGGFTLFHWRCGIAHYLIPQVNKKIVTCKNCLAKRDKGGTK